MVMAPLMLFQWLEQGKQTDIHYSRDNSYVHSIYRLQLLPESCQQAILCRFVESHGRGGQDHQKGLHFIYSPLSIFLPIRCLQAFYTDQHCQRNEYSTPSLLQASHQQVTEQRSDSYRFTALLQLKEISKNKNKINHYHAHISSSPQ